MEYVIRMKGKELSGPYLTQSPMNDSMITTCIYNYCTWTYYRMQVGVHKNKKE